MASTTSTNLTTISNHKYLPNLLKIGTTVGGTVIGSIVLFGTLDGLTKRPPINWYNIAIWGSIGSIIGAQFGLRSWR